MNRCRFCGKPYKDHPRSVVGHGETAADLTECQRAALKELVAQMIAELDLRQRSFAEETWLRRAKEVMRPFSDEELWA